MDDSSSPAPVTSAPASEPTLVHSQDARPGDPTSTGVMKALVLVDHLREERRSADDRRLAALMRRSRREG